MVETVTSSGSARGLPTSCRLRSRLHPAIVLAITASPLLAAHCGVSLVDEPARSRAVAHDRLLPGPFFPPRVALARVPNPESLDVNDGLPFGLAPPSLRDGPPKNL